MKAKKPQAILDLEKAYNIEIPDLSSQERIGWSVKRYFKQDSSGAVVELRLRECQIESMTWLIDFPALKSLDLSHNRISKLEGLERLTSLAELYLLDNQISKLEGRFTADWRESSEEDRGVGALLQRRSHHRPGGA